MGTITKALEMLNYFSREKPEIGLGEFVRLTRRDKATVHRHLGELVENGFLEQHPATRAYRLGPAILRLSAVREATHPARRLIRPIVSDLADRIGELAHASLLQGDQLSPVFHDDPKRYGTQVHFDEAEMLPLHATSSGHAVLAFADPALVDRVLTAPMARFTDRTQTDPESLRAQIISARDTGIGKAERTFDDEVTSESVALFDASGQPVGALAVIIPAVRASDEKWTLIRPLLIEAAQAATQSLGGSFPADHPLKEPVPTADR
ncbi:IclR family transcriptional regulator [Antarctobacter jejuensis]|uniref:IclR family transcriptional regulator n=1 Tax=Antarctobacter jejuensis TaxID=1439938 RepID=UPI003FD645C7